MLSGVQKDLGPKGLRVIGLAIDQNAAQSLYSFVEKAKANFPIGVYDNQAARDYLQLPIMNRMMMPQIAIIDRKGMIVDQHAADDAWMKEDVMEKNIRAAAAKLLNQGPAPAAKK